MKRFAVGVPGIMLIAALSPSTEAAAESDTVGEVDPLDQIVRLSAGKVPRDAVERFMAADRETQKRILEAAGFTDPGGDIDQEPWRQSLLGQWLVMQGDTVRGTELQVRSGTLSPERSLTLTQAIAPGVSATEAEISDTMLATGMSYDDAAERARLQRLASLLRPALSEVDNGYL